MIEEPSVQHLRELIRILVRKFGLLHKSSAPCCGITFRQCHAIVEIGRMESCSLQVLSEVLDLDKSTTSRLVESLVKVDLAMRTNCANDRRAVQIKLTEKGFNVFNQVNNDMYLYYQSIISLIPVEKRVVVLEAIPLLLEAVTKSSPLKS